MPLEQVAFYWICRECQRGFNRYGWLVFHGPRNDPAHEQEKFLCRLCGHFHTRAHQVIDRPDCCDWCACEVPCGAADAEVRI